MLDAGVSTIADFRFRIAEPNECGIWIEYGSEGEISMKMKLGVRNTKQVRMIKIQRPKF